MKKTAAAAFLLTACVAGSAVAQDLSLDAKRMLAYGTTAVMVGACDMPITAKQKERMNSGLAKYAEKQTELTQADFAELMKAAGAQIGANKAEVCAQVLAMDVDVLLADAEQGK